MAQLIMTVEEMKDRDAWLKLRNTGLGGSDAGIIVGVNPWRSRLALWAEKTGQAEPEDLSANERIYWGAKLEDMVAEWFCEKTGKRVRRRGMMRSCEYPWMLASLDREVVGEKAGLEIKTTGAEQWRNWEDDNIPDTYYCQVQWYMAVTGFDRWYIAVLIGGNRAIWKEVARNQAQIDMLIREGGRFWELVENRVPPEPDGSDSAARALEAQYSHTVPDPIRLDNLQEVYDRMMAMDRAEKAAKASKEEAKQLIMARMGEHELAQIGEHKVTWKVQAGRVTLDSKGLKKDHPDIYDQYKKVGNPTRVFRV